MASFTLRKKRGGHTFCCSRDALQHQFAVFAWLLTNANGQDLLENWILSLPARALKPGWPFSVITHLPQWAVRWLNAPLITSPVRREALWNRPMCRKWNWGLARFSVLTPQPLNLSPSHQRHAGPITATNNADWIPSWNLIATKSGIVHGEHGNLRTDTPAAARWLSRLSLLFCDELCVGYWFQLDSLSA